MHSGIKAPVILEKNMRDNAPPDTENSSESIVQNVTDKECIKFELMPEDR